jgi:hypothetical protein
MSANCCMFVTACCGRKFKNDGKPYQKHMAAKGGKCARCDVCCEVFPDSGALKRHTCAGGSDRVMARLEKMERGMESLKREVRGLRSSNRRLCYLLSQSKARERDIDKHLERLGRDLFYTGFRQHALEKFIEDSPIKFTWIHDSLNDLWARIDKRKVSTAPVFNTLNPLEPKGCGDAGPDHLDKVSRETLGWHEEQLRRVIHDIQNTRTFTELNSDDKRMYKSRIHKHVSVLDRCGYSYPRGIPVVPLLGGLRLSKLWKARKQTPRPSPPPPPKPTKPKFKPTGDADVDRVCEGVLALQGARAALRQLPAKARAAVDEYLGYRFDVDTWGNEGDGCLSYLAGMELDLYLTPDASGHAVDSWKNPKQRPFPTRMPYPASYEIRREVDGYIISETLAEMRQERVYHLDMISSTPRKKKTDKEEIARREEEVRELDAILATW